MYVIILLTIPRVLNINGPECPERFHHPRLTKLPPGSRVSLRESIFFLFESWSSTLLFFFFFFSLAPLSHHLYQLYHCLYRQHLATDRSLDRSIARSIGRSLDRSVARSLGRSVARSIVRSLDRSVVRSIARSLDRLITRSIARPLDRSVARLLGRSIARSLDRSRHNHGMQTTIHELRKRPIYRLRLKTHMGVRGSLSDLIS